MTNHKMVILILIVVFTISSYAQIQKGVYSIRGSASYAKNEMEYSSFTVKTTSFTFSPALTYFLTDYIEMNWSVNYNELRSNNLFFNSSNTFTTVSAGLRLYYPIKDIALFGGSAIGRTDASRRMSYSIEGGLDYFIFSNISLEPVIVYSNEETDTMKSTGTKFFVGFRYFMQ